MQREVWVVKGTITDLEAYEAENAQRMAEGKALLGIGDTEWQFSDGPPGERGSSSDYFSLEQGLAAYSGYVIHFVED